VVEGWYDIFVAGSFLRVLEMKRGIRSHSLTCSQVVTALVLCCGSLRSSALPSELNEWGGNSIGHILQDLFVG